MVAGKSYVGLSLVFFCHDGQRNFLLGKRSEKCRDEVGKWDIGSCEYAINDSIVKKIETEIREQYSTKPLHQDFLGYREIRRFNDLESTHWLSLDFKVLIDPALVKLGKLEKFDELVWIPFDEIPNLLSYSQKIGLGRKNLHSQLPRFLEKYGKMLIK